MKLAKVSLDRLTKSFDYWDVDEEYKDPMFKYLVYGYHPGSFFHNVLANDFMGAIARSHELNTIRALKRLVNWIYDFMPKEAYGSHGQVDIWVKMSENQRRMYLEKANLIYEHRQEMWETLLA